MDEKNATTENVSVETDDNPLVQKFTKMLNLPYDERPDAFFKIKELLLQP